MAFDAPKEVKSVADIAYENTQGAQMTGYPLDDPPLFIDSALNFDAATKGATARLQGNAEALKQFNEMLAKDPRIQVALPGLTLGYLELHCDAIAAANDDGEGVSKEDLKKYGEAPQRSETEKLMINYAINNFEKLRGASDRGGDNIGMADVLAAEKEYSEGRAGTKYARVAALLDNHKDAAGSDGVFSRDDLKNLQSNDSEELPYLSDAYFEFDKVRGIDKHDGSKPFLKFWEQPGNAGGITASDIQGIKNRTKMLASFGIGNEVLDEAMKADHVTQLAMYERYVKNQDSYRG